MRTQQVEDRSKFLLIAYVKSHGQAVSCALNAVSSKPNFPSGTKRSVAQTNLKLSTLSFQLFTLILFIINFAVSCQSCFSRRGQLKENTRVFPGSRRY